MELSQSNMETTVQRLSNNDQLILTEFMNLSKNMAAKDDLIRQFLQIAVNRDKGKFLLINFIVFENRRFFFFDN